jgi:hypothetical protein
MASEGVDEKIDARTRSDSWVLKTTHIAKQAYQISPQMRAVANVSRWDCRFEHITMKGEQSSNTSNCRQWSRLSPSGLHDYYKRPPVCRETDLHERDLDPWVNPYITMKGKQSSNTSNYRQWSRLSPSGLHDY